MGVPAWGSMIPPSVAALGASAAEVRRGGPGLTGTGPLGRSGVEPSGTPRKSYEREFLGRTSVQRPGFWAGLVLGLLSR